MLSLLPIIICHHGWSIVHILLYNVRIPAHDLWSSTCVALRQVESSVLDIVFNLHKHNYVANTLLLHVHVYTM